LAVAAVAVLGIGLATAGVIAATGAADASAAARDVRLTAAFAGSEAALGLLVEELEGDSGPDLTGRAFETLGSAATELRPDDLDGLGSDPARSVLADPPARLAAARADAGLPGLMADLRETLSALAGLIGDPSLAANAALQADEASRGQTPAQAEGDRIVKASESILTSARARFVTGLVCCAAAVAALAVLITRLMGHSGSLRERIGLLASRLNPFGGGGGHVAGRTFQRLEPTPAASYQPVTRIMPEPSLPLTPVRAAPEHDEPPPPPPEPAPQPAPEARQGPEVPEEPEAPPPPPPPFPEPPATPAAPGTQEMSLAALLGPEGPVPVIEVLRESVAQLGRPRQVRWSIHTSELVSAVQAPRLAHAVAELVDAATGKSEAIAVLVRATSSAERLVITVSDRLPGEGRGDLALGPKPGAVLTLVRRMGAALTASPNESGSGTDTILSVPLASVID
jgi:hypothetical protein